MLLNFVHQPNRRISGSCRVSSSASSGLPPNPGSPSNGTSDQKPPTLPKHLSPSSIEAWKQCPLVFRSRYIDKIKEPPTTALARGIAAHDGLEKLYTTVPPRERTVDVLHNLFRAAWGGMRKEERYQPLFAGDLEQERAWGLESLQLLAEYFDLEDPATVSPLQCEKWLSAEFSADESTERAAAAVAQEGAEERMSALREDARRTKVVGVLDRIDRDPQTGHLVVVDYKTGKAPNIDKYAAATQARIIDEKFFQLRVYAILVQRATGELPKELRLLFLGSGDDIRMRMRAEDAERTRAEVLDVWAAVVAAVEKDDFRCHDPAACPYCSGRWVRPWDNRAPLTTAERAPAEGGGVSPPAS